MVVRAVALAVALSVAAVPTAAWAPRVPSLGCLQHRRLVTCLGAGDDAAPLSSDGAERKAKRGHQVLTGLASVGAVETGYLTVTRLTGSEAFCGTDGAMASTCSSVLSGPFSVVPALNVPLVALAFVAYTTIAALSARAATASASSDSGSLANSSSLVLFMTTTMATFSAYLLFVLTSVLQSSCAYCYVSAALSLGMAGVAWTHRIVPGATRAFVLSLSSVAATTVTSALLFYATSVGLGAVEPAQAQAQASASASVSQSAVTTASALVANANTNAGGKVPPAVTGASSKQALDIAARLERLGARMYGAYWCSHCNNQKQALGKEAVHKFVYVECDKEGADSQFDLCKANKVPGYPTWQIQGKLYPGEKTLDELQVLLDGIEGVR